VVGKPERKGSFTRSEDNLGDDIKMFVKENGGDMMRAGTKSLDAGQWRNLIRNIKKWNVLNS
jgi:hypothetical protein